MKEEEIHLGDFRRWLIGQTTPEFMIEVTIRTLLLYLILLITVRLLGKRMTAQMTITELSVMLTLGAIISPAAQLPDRGLMFGVTGLMVAVIFQRGLNLWAFNNPRIDELSQGRISLVIKDGILMLEALDQSHITKQQIFALLREKKINNLGSVKRAYLEASGSLSIFEETVNKPGLPVFPSDDPIVDVEQTQSPEPLRVCTNCGQVQHVSNPENKCDVCHADSWIKAYSAK